MFDATYDASKDILYRLYLIATILGVIGGIVGVVVLIRQTILLSRTVKSATEQSEAMERHIDEATRSANAMEAISKNIEDGNQAIMRAYLTVNIGGAVYQQRRGPGQTDLHFEAKPLVVNTGNTHARKVRIRKKAAILASPTPDNFQYPAVPEESNVTYATLAAHQSYIINAIVQDFVADGEVQAIKEGNGKALHVWGVITYEDIFGKTHTARFGQLLTWQPDGSVYGYYTPGQNDAD